MFWYLREGIIFEVRRPRAALAPENVSAPVVTATGNNDSQVLSLKKHKQRPRPGAWYPTDYYFTFSARVSSLWCMCCSKWCIVASSLSLLAFSRANIISRALELLCVSCIFFRSWSSFVFLVCRCERKCRRAVHTIFCFVFPLWCRMFRFVLQQSSGVLFS